MKSNTLTFTTNRLILRKFSIDDLVHLYKFLTINKFLPMFPLKNLDEAKNLLNKEYLKSYKKSYGYKYAICLKENNIPIDYINISSDNNHDLGYGLLKGFWHKGIITETCKTLLMQAKDDGIRYISATHDINNPRSGSVMKALGMSYQYTQLKNFFVNFRMYQLNFNKNASVYMEYWNKYSTHYIETNF